jgi:hypothetical protein
MDLSQTNEKLDDRHVLKQRLAKDMQYCMARLKRGQLLLLEGGVPDL